MICKRCQIAGDMVAEARSMDLNAALEYDNSSFAGIDSISIREAVGSVAHLFHGLCKGSGHCDCQHKVDFEGKSIQKESVNGGQA